MGIRPFRAAKSRAQVQNAGVPILTQSGCFQAVTLPNGSAKLRAAVDLQPTNSIYILPLLLAASRPDLEQLIRQDSHICSICAEAAQVSAGATDIPAAIINTKACMSMSMLLR